MELEHTIKGYDKEINEMVFTMLNKWKPHSDLNTLLDEENCALHIEN